MRHAALLLALFAFACAPPTGRGSGGGGGGDGTDAGGSGTGGTGGTGNDAGGSGSGGPQCVGNLCTSACGEAQSPTSISGVVYDPAGNNPLYDIVVFIPSAAPAKLPSGAACDTCSSLYTGSPVAVALTDAAGKFTLTNTPDGKNIPIVVQVGKWRRQLVIPSVVPCKDNALPDRWLRLPRNRSEGDIPRIAISTGSADTLECLLSRVGIDGKEYVGGASGDQRIHIFAGGDPSFTFGQPNTNPPGPPSSSGLWASKSMLMPYDIVLLSCEGDETTSMNQQALHDYASAGGRVFASHFHYAWFNTGPYASENVATWSAGTNDLSNIDTQIVTSFPKGKALSDWLKNVGALQNGVLPIQDAKHNADVSASNKASQEWIIAAQNSGAPGAAEYFSFNTPTNAPLDADAGVPNYCGRVVYSDLHVGAAAMDYQSGGGTLETPTGCSSGMLSPQEKALEFMLFDLSSCVVPDSEPPVPPVG